MIIEQNVSLKPYNTFGIDVEAAHLASFRTVEQLQELLASDLVKHGKHLVLGGGSNVLLTANYDGIVMRNCLEGIELVAQDEDHYYVKAAAGVVWHKLVMDCVANGYAGLENLALIPGCVGASPMQNIGAYGVEIKDVFHQLEALHIRTGELKSFNLDECSFGYRESYFKRAGKGEWIILSVTYRLRKRPVLNTSYGSIEEELDRMKLDRVTIKDVANAVINIRSSKLPDPKVLGNAGSFFKNPVVGIEVLHEIRKTYPTVPSYPISDLEVKVPAGWLIEQAGWKGKVVGNCGVHKNQALVLVNYGNASGSEVYQLSAEIIGDIQSKFGITLEREVNII